MGLPHFCACEEAQKCCEDAPKVVLCPENSQEDYCDCDGDCLFKPSFCSCAEAQECCNGVVDATSAYEDFEEEFDGEDVVYCPENTKEDYCDCDGDCYDMPSFCSCSEAKECCKDAAYPWYFSGISFMRSFYNSGLSNLPGLRQALI